jgi:hypothetical protein
MQKSSTCGWENLNCPFFTGICRQVLGNYFEKEGFSEKDVTPIGGIIYTRFNIFAEISYDAATCPNYSPSVVIGIGDGLYDARGGLSGIPMWYLLKNSQVIQNHLSFKFKTKSDLVSALNKIKDEFLDNQAKQLWLDNEKLEKCIENFHVEFAT